jgi:septum site-determining protein MinD
LGILASKSKRAEEKLEPIREHLLVTRYSPGRVERGDMLALSDIEELLAIPLLGVIPESHAVLRASNSGIPVTFDQESDAGQAYLDAVDRFLGHKVPLRFVNTKKRTLLQRLFSAKEGAPA